MDTSKKIYEIINYIVGCFKDNPSKLGKVKLAKILWFADREFMYKYHSELTGLEYQKLPFGPVPKKYDQILNDMQKKSYIFIDEIFKDDTKQILFTSLKKPCLDDFSAKEVEILDKIIFSFKDEKASCLSKITHDDLYNSVQIGDIMPVESVFWQDIETPNADDIKWAIQSLKDKGIKK